MWRSSDEEIVQVMQEYFRDVFHSSFPSEMDLDAATRYIQSIVYEDQSRILDASFSALEIRQALWDVGSLKAPNPDGFSALFYQIIRM